MCVKYFSAVIFTKIKNKVLPAINQAHIPQDRCNQLKMNLLKQLNLTIYLNHFFYKYLNQLKKTIFHIIVILFVNIIPRIASSDLMNCYQ